MDYPDYFGSIHDPFDGALPSSFAAQAPSSPANPGTPGHLIALVVMGVLLTAAVAVACWMYFRRDLQPAEATPFSAAIASIQNPQARAHAEALDRAYAAASSDDERQRITTALSVAMGNHPPVSDRQASGPQPPSAPRRQPLSPPPAAAQPPPAEPPTIYRAPPGDPNFVRL